MEIILNRPRKYNPLLTVIAFLFWASVSAIHINALHHQRIRRMEAEAAHKRVLEDEAINKRIEDTELFQWFIQSGNIEGVTSAIKAGFDVNSKEIIFICGTGGGDLEYMKNHNSRTMLTFTKDVILADESFAKFLKSSVYYESAFSKECDAHKRIYAILVEAGARP